MGRERRERRREGEMEEERWREGRRGKNRIYIVK